MRMYDLITKKKHGEKLSDKEIDYIISGFTGGTIPDYQMSAFLMAVYFKGMDTEETINLTKSMINSGETLDLSRINGLKADKHSTGGVGDKTSLIVCPMVASLGVPVAKMSGRGLGHTGGTIDKLESFKGFSVDIDFNRFIDNVNRVGLSIIGQTKELCPADKKIYALRDVTATVDNKSLIASSIMSKKLAAGTDAIVLDVKVGSGAFMKTLDEAVELAELMVLIGHKFGKKTYAVLSDMSNPLGEYVGNSLEVYEAIKALNGDAPKDLTESCLTLAAYMLMGVNKASNYDEAVEMLKGTITSKKALNKLAEFVSAQGGDTDCIYNPEKLIGTKYQKDIKVAEDGYVKEILTDEIGMTSLILGGGRETKDSVIDLSVGIKINKKVGDKVNKGDTIATLYANDENKMAQAEERLRNAYKFSDGPVSAPKHILGVVTETKTTVF